MTLSQSAYDKAQWFIRIFIPSFVALYVGVDQFVNLPKELEVAGVSAVLAVFLGGLLTKSSSDFKKTNEADAGTISSTGADPDTGIPGLGLVITKLPQELLTKNTITLKVDHTAGPPPVLDEPSPPVDNV